MTKLFALLAAFILPLFGCTSSGGNELFENASPETSALELYIYDGETTERGFIFDTSLENEILSSLSSTSAKKSDDFTPDKITLPIYGLNIGGKDRYDFSIAWTNGYLITQDGETYRFNYDFASLESGNDWGERDKWQSSAVLPCAHYLSNIGGQWNKDMLTPASELTPPESISLELISFEEDTVKVKFTNSGSEEWCYGEYFSLNVLLDGVWYEIPSKSPMLFHDIAYILPSGISAEASYNLSPYGILPVGKYRIISSSLTAEFDIGEN